MRRLRIGLDVDGVLADFIAAACDIAIQLGFDPDPTVWDIGLSEPQLDQLWERIRATENFWLRLNPFSPTNLQEVQHKHTLIFITSRVPLNAGDSVEQQTATWLNHLLGIDFPTVLVVGRPQIKPKLYRQLALDSYIDDKAETVVAMRKLGQNCYVFDQPWNRNAHMGLIGEDHRRVKSIEEYISDVEKRLAS
jgi:uncharacterized HAD superfamily protein